MMRENHPKAENKHFEYTEEMQPGDILQKFIDIFSNKGWLNQTIRIKHRNRKYSVLCSEKTFIAYRINDNWGVPPGIPGWPVCIIDQDQIVEDAGLPASIRKEPDAYDWLCCIADGDFEMISEVDVDGNHC